MSLSASSELASTPSGPAPRAELLHILMLPDLERADWIGEFWGYPESREFAEPLINCKEDRVCGRGSSACCERPIVELLGVSLRPGQKSECPNG